MCRYSAALAEGLHIAASSLHATNADLSTVEHLSTCDLLVALKPLIAEAIARQHSVSCYIVENLSSMSAAMVYLLASPPAEVAHGQPVPIVTLQIQSRRHLGLKCLAGGRG